MRTSARLSSVRFSSAWRCPATRLIARKRARKSSTVASSIRSTISPDEWASGILDRSIGVDLVGDDDGKAAGVDEGPHGGQLETGRVGVGARVGPLPDDRGPLGKRVELEARDLLGVEDRAQRVLVDPEAVVQEADAPPLVGAVKTEIGPVSGVTSTRVPSWSS